jgi:stearoyl-CoA desaturase (delta-9 desaturase)
VIDLSPAPPPGVTGSPSAQPAAEAEQEYPVSRLTRFVNLLAVLIPFAGVLLAIYLLWGIAIDATHLAIGAGMFLITALGITVGFHRLCTHHAFRAPAWVRYGLAAAGSMAAEGPVIEWCAEHRRHHQMSDTAADPHSPRAHKGGDWGTGVVATLRGAFHAHVGWLFARTRADLTRYARDLTQDRALALANAHFRWLVLAGLVLPGVLAGLITGSWSGALLGVLWGGLVRMFLVHHVTWSVNSVCHMWGSRPFSTGDESRNNAIVGILALGEGWHNNHHAFPTSARHGLRWWEIDVSYACIRLLELVGLAKHVRRPAPERVAAKRRNPGRTPPR